MKIAVVCANGRVGQLITKEALQRGLDVTAVVRGENRSAAPRYISRDVLDLTALDLKGFDVVVDAFGAWTEETLPLHSVSLKVLCDALSGTDTRLMVVGGAGSLYVNREHTACVADGPDFPDMFKPLAAAMAKSAALSQKGPVMPWQGVTVPAWSWRPKTIWKVWHFAVSPPESSIFPMIGRRRLPQVRLKNSCRKKPV